MHIPHRHLCYRSRTFTLSYDDDTTFLLSFIRLFRFLFTMFCILSMLRTFIFKVRMNVNERKREPHNQRPKYILLLTNQLNLFWFDNCILSRLNSTIHTFCLCCCWCLVHPFSHSMGYYFRSS